MNVVALKKKKKSQKGDVGGIWFLGHSLLTLL